MSHPRQPATEPFPQRTKLETISSGTWKQLPDLPAPHNSFQVVGLSIGDDGTLWAVDSAAHTFLFIVDSGNWCRRCLNRIFFHRRFQEAMRSMSTFGR